MKVSDEYITPVIFSDGFSGQMILGTISDLKKISWTLTTICSFVSKNDFSFWVLRLCLIYGYRFKNTLKILECVHQWVWRSKNRRDEGPASKGLKVCVRLGVHLHRVQQNPGIKILKFQKLICLRLVCVFLIFICSETFWFEHKSTKIQTIS